MRIIFSRDRAAQLDLLLRSLDRFAAPEETWAIVHWSDDEFHAGYEQLEADHPGVRLMPEGTLGGWDFERAVRWLLEAGGATTTFLCDDDVMFAPAPFSGHAELELDELLCFSLRLGVNTTVQYPTGFPQIPPAVDLGPWPWRLADGDFSYPGSIDGHVFRTADLVELLDGATFPNPTALECVLADRIAAGAIDRRPLMWSYPHSVLVGVPVNRVSRQSNVRFGTVKRMSAELANAAYLRGQRLDLDRIDFSKVDGAHTELELVWTRAKKRRDVVSFPVKR